MVEGLQTLWGGLQRYLSFPRLILSPRCHSGCQPLVCHTRCLILCLPGRKGLKCPDFPSVVLEGKMTCRSDWREGDLQNCFARHILMSGES